MIVMIKVNVAEAKAHFSGYLATVQKGETVVICNRNQPIAELRGLIQVGNKPRPVGLAKRLVKVPPSFFEPLPDGLMAAFRGE